MGLYEIWIAVGFFLCLLYLRVMADRLAFPAKLQNLCIVGALCAIIGCYGCSVLSQAVYNALETGIFEIAQDTGATFYGGLVGGGLIFVAVYLIAGHFLFPDGTAKKRFFEMSAIAAGSIAIAHAFGRIGCLCAGCCYGKPTDAWYGIYNAHLGVKTIPVQLFETLFLLALAAFLTWRLLRQRSGNLAVYLMSYAVWRFLIEYLRADDRGATVVSFLSPSQLTAVLLFAGGIVWYLAEKRLSGGKKAKKTDA